MKILVFGSFNIDHVYMLEHLPEKGETLYCSDYGVHVGGKGLNQALAFKKAGADVYAAGKVGRTDGAYLTGYLADAGVDVCSVSDASDYSGHTIIEVDPSGQNQMILFGGANREITREECDRVLSEHRDADLIMTEYETSEVEYMLRKAHEAGIRTAMNPSPFVDELRSFPYEYVDIIIVNEFEGNSISGCSDEYAAVRALYELNHGIVIMTLGAKGALYFDGTEPVFVPAFSSKAVDTTGAGDTFTGYCIYSLLEGKNPHEALRIGSAASAIEITRPGAAETIPDRAEVDEFLTSRP